MAQALIRSELQSQKGQANQAQQSQQQQTFVKSAQAAPAKTFNKGMTIRGLAGPFVVMAQNFAPGTTAADIESAMTPVGGIVTSCRVVKQHPIVIAEIVFESKEGADNVIATFNNQTVCNPTSPLILERKLTISNQADGRVLSVYPKVGNTPSAPSPARPASDVNDMVVDGSYGFEPMETEHSSPKIPTGPAADRGGLYSDRLAKNRWGRGFNNSGRFSGR